MRAGHFPSATLLMRGSVLRESVSKTASLLLVDQSPDGFLHGRGEDAVYRALTMIAGQQNVPMADILHLSRTAWRAQSVPFQSSPVQSQRETSGCGRFSRILGNKQCVVSRQEDPAWKRVARQYQQRRAHVLQRESTPLLAPSSSSHMEEYMFPLRLSRPAPVPSMQRREEVSESRECRR